MGWRGEEAIPARRGERNEEGQCQLGDAAWPMNFGLVTIYTP